jgi:hypothetical protein
VRPAGIFGRVWVIFKDGGPDMAPKPPTLGSGPAKPGRSSERR